MDSRHGKTPGSKRDCYSSLKVFHHQDRLDALRRGEHPAPVHVHFVPTNRCPHNCQFCAYKNIGYSSSETFDPRHEIPAGRLLRLVGELKDCGVLAVELTGGGEPSVHPQFSELCTTILNKGLDLGVVTNGSHMPPETISLLTRAKWVRFSIDAGNRDTYSNIRKVKPEIYDKVRENLRTLVLERAGASDPVIGVGFVATRDNWEELLQAARNADEDGVDNLRISAVFQNDGAEYFRDFYPGVHNACQRAEALTNGTFTVFNLFGNRVEDLHQASPEYSYCGVQRLVCYIGADLNVYRCCVLAYNKRGLLGSIKDRTFGEFWNDPVTRRRLDKFDATSCERCMFNAKNRTINYAIDEHPDHVNFL